MLGKPTYEELEQRIRDLESELLKYKGGVSEDFKNLADQLLDGIYQYDLLSRKFTLLNKRFYEFFKFEEGGKEVVTTKSVLLRIHPEYRDKVRNASAESIAPGSDGGEVEYCLLREDGSEKWMQDRWIVIRDNSGRPVAIQGAVRDDTERKKADEALRVSEERYRTILESIDEGYYEVDLKGNFTFVNNSMCKIRGASMDELIGMNNQEYMDQKNAKRVYRKFKEVYRTGIPVKKIEWESMRKDGIQRHVESSASLMKDSNGNPVGFRGITADITERKQAEKALRESEERHRSLVECSSDAILMLDVDRKIVSCNEAFSNLFGYDKNEAIGKSIRLIHPSDESFRSFGDVAYPKIEKVSSFRTEWEFVSKDATICPTETTTSVIMSPNGLMMGYVAIIRDMTNHKKGEEEKQKLQTQLQQSKKMEAIANLAGGIAHEFNNALTGVVGNIELLEMRLPDNKTVTEHTGPMKSSSHRMANLTSQLLAYARGGRYQAKTISLSAFVEETLPVIKSNIGSSIHIDTDLPRDILKVNADSAQMQMVFSAVMHNSSEAIEGEGRIRVITSNEEIDAEFVKSQSDLTPGPYVCLAVEDDGEGMDEETLNKIFDPFYTTKFIGRGLGMASVYGIIRNHGGSISVDSDLGKGTVVRIYFPAFEDKEEELSKKPAEEARVISGEGTILVIEDEETVMNVIRDILDKLGYRMLEAKTGKEAIEIAETFDGQIDLALLDIKLPDIWGDVVYPLIMKARPKLKVIVCSGYSIDGPAQEILDAGAQDFIQKPFSVKELSQKLGEILDRE